MKRIAMLLAFLPALALGADKVTLKMADPHPDRTNTWGAVIEVINAEFKAANPGVEIVTESPALEREVTVGRRELRVEAGAEEVDGVLHQVVVRGVHRVGQRAKHG